MPKFIKEEVTYSIRQESRRMALAVSKSTDHDAIKKRLLPFLDPDTDERNIAIFPRQSTSQEVEFDVIVNPVVAQTVQSNTVSPCFWKTRGLADTSGSATGDKSNERRDETESP